jgi:4-amino-4-deoxy-L-arabinose transferase-like glycosyltransferase
MDRLRIIFAAVAVAYLLAPLIASAPLFDPDEGLHAAIAQEMVLRGDYVTPTFLGQPFLDKPILFFWAEAASLRVFGHNETAVRIPPLLFALLGMLAVALLGRAFFDEATGLVAGIIYATMLLPLGVSQVAVHDIGLIPFMCTAAYCLHRVSLASAEPYVASAFRRKILLASIGAGVCLGLSILTKGLVGIVFVGIFAACLAVYRPRGTMRLAVALTIAVAVAAIVAAPWYFAMEAAHPGYLHYYFVERHVQGYLTATQRHAGRPWWYYVPIVVGGALPWTGYLAGALRGVLPGSPHARKPWRTAGLPTVTPGRRRVLWGWFAIGLVFLSLGESKLVTYALPLFPILALIVAEQLSSAGFRMDVMNRFRIAAFGVHVLTLAVLPPLGLLALQWKFSAAHPYLWIAVALFSLLTIDAGRRAMRSATEYGFIAWLARASVYTLIGMMAVLPRAASWMTSRDLAETLNTAGALPPRVSVLDERIGSLVFYLDPALRAEANTTRLDEASFSEAIGRVRVDPDDAVLAVRNTQLAQFNRLFATPPVPDARAGTFTIFRAVTLREALQPAPDGGILKPPRRP